MLGLMVVRLACGVYTELLPEEAYYWTYAKHPAWGYFDHPPMVAWVIHFGTLFLGDTELGVRLGCILLAAVSCWLVVRVAELWFDRRAAVMAGWMFLLVPVFLGMGFLGMPDAPLLFFWLVTLYAVSRALLEERSAWWWLAGVAYGGALLSKYYALLLGPSLLLFLLISPRYRFWLRRPQPWLAVVVALLVFSPVMVWNSQNQWASFAFQSTRTVDQRASGWSQSLWFWLAQVLLPTPLLFVLFVMVVRRWVKCWVERSWSAVGGERWNFAVAFSLPVVALFALASAKGAFRLNWTAPAFLSLLPAAAALLWEKLEVRSRGWRWASGVTAAACVVVVLVAHTGMALVRVNLLGRVRFGGWHQLA